MFDLVFVGTAHLERRAANEGEVILPVDVRGYFLYPLKIDNRRAVHPLEN